MNENIQVYGSPHAGSPVAAQRNQVLRNTYWLLALSMVPTVLGAWLGVATGMTRSLTGGLGLVVFMGGAFGFMFAIEKTKNSSTGVAVLLGFTFFMGLMLSRLLGAVLGLSNGATLIALAFGGTSAVFVTMATLATTIKRDLAPMGKFLFVGMIMLLVAGFANIFLQIPAMAVTISAIAVLIFSAYILYDVSNIIRGGETNYIMATLGLFLNIYNIFISLLNILMALTGQRD